jgi:hypothetical protein
MLERAFDAGGRTSRSLSAQDLIDPLTRCLTASLYRQAVGPDEGLTPKFAWTAVEKRIGDIITQWLGGRRGIGDDLAQIALQGIAVVFRLARRRLMTALSAFIGDVLVYPQNREAILLGLERKVQEAVADAPGGKLWLVGHSLGGIVCYDYCLRTERTVDHLFTVGSQVGLFGEFGAVATVEAIGGQNLETPANVRRWTNIYDHNDMLSFLAEPIFTRVLDVHLDTESPFPVAHSEYWNRPGLYEILAMS